MKAALAILGTLLALTVAHGASLAKPFERLDGCRLIPNRWNDGDSFHVRLPDAREIVARLYFVDTIESETAWRAFTGRARRFTMAGIRGRISPI